MFFNRNRSSFVKGLVLGMLAGAAVGAASVIACDEDRMRCVKKFAKKGWRSVSENFR